MRKLQSRKEKRRPIRNLLRKALPLFASIAICASACGPLRTVNKPPIVKKVDIQQLVKVAKDKSKDDFVRGEAIEKLGKTKDLGSIRPLVGILRGNDSDYVKHAALSALSRIVEKNPTDIRSIGLVSTLLDMNRDKRFLDGTTGILRILAENNRSDPNARRIVPRMLEVFRDRKQFRVTRENAGLAVFYVTKNRHVRELVPFFLDGVKANFAFHSSKHQYYPPAIIHSLYPTFGTLGSRCYTGQRANWRYTDIFTEMGRPAVPSLIALFRSQDICIRIYSLYALQDVGKPAVQYLIKALASYERIIHSNASSALDLIGIRAIPDLVGSLGSPNPRIREVAVRMLGQLHLGRFPEEKGLDTAAIDTIIKLLKDKDNAVRLEAINTLRIAKSRKALPELRRVAMKDPDKGVRNTAKKAIKRISGGSP